jgi:hypothetical protein
MKVGGAFFDVRLKWQEVLIDEGRDFVVRVGLGLQPSARASSRGRAEIDQQRFLRLFGLSQGRVRVLAPLN